MRNSVVLVLWQSPEPAAFPQLTHVKYLHTAQSVRCWEQIESAVLFRACHASDYKSRRELSITSVSRHHTLKRWYLHLHSQLLLSSHLVLTNTTISSMSVGRRMSMLASFIEAVSQADRQTDRRDGCVLSARSVQHLMIHLLSKLTCFRVQLHEVSRQQTDRKADWRHHGNETEMAN